jgi:putative holliday junction resolvase
MPALPPSPQILLAFDYGTRRIGVASGDTLTRTARALTTLEHKGAPPWANIAKLIADYQPNRLIVGLPCNMDGTATTTTAPAQAFARELEQRYRLPVVLVDERLSSREAASELRDARAEGLKKRRTVHADLDKVAARLLLERWYAEGAAPELTKIRPKSDSER